MPGADRFPETSGKDFQHRAEKVRSTVGVNENGD